MHLPPHIQSLASFKTLKMEKDSFIDKTLKKSILDHWLQEGREEGRRKEKIIIAKNLIKAGLKTDLIIASTRLKKEEIEKLQQTA
ncbi:hypothetical protein RAS_02850 [Rickettsia asiatica]|uniref:Transposase (putative) YhgA-like domain-containing protein n=2 Tax=Rickettsia asiatica TaxID=238800 RepID=A0A510G6U6_9RICK|nr:hypothetical protein RAS_02850 [Rickettsia asiatica]